MFLIPNNNLLFMTSYFNVLILLKLNIFSQPKLVLLICLTKLMEIWNVKR